ncbi:phosphotransferase family protein [Phycicoccus endophyticus]|uniref:Phosphotransferase family protein n=1 Tax=Phycicoccus endophyticus TaxID=1690220 RepID=A0A7G9R115_9MICO|nr:phosphotransferase family protein [Phycicoccus endophyticus]NHI20583.1 phosphotransferase family protein [Phycicoccus endophyticus]QNN49290.1 phosphotransferase family protein [Phycicoccus endophyticus]GGL44924.1 acyl-CoA dehydrogenase [Phycicoccus endophyticus]
MSPSPTPPGLEPDALTAWWRRVLGDDPDTALAGPTRPLDVELVAGGKSNLTYRVGDGERTWVVRRPPLGHVLATAHDMGREHRVVSALAPTAVPVPATYAFCADESVVGAPFYVMSDVPGTPYRTVGQLAPLGEARTRAISERLVDTLAALHAVEPEAVGLADFGRPEGFLGRQVTRWRTQMATSLTTERPLESRLARALADGVEGAEAEARPGIVHGDYRLDNLLVDDHDQVAAVLDWEMATLGDTRTDLALLVLYGRLADLAPGAVADAVRAPGHLDERGMLERYAATCGLGPVPLDFHLGLAAYKLAAILEGIHHRYLAGQTVGEGFAGVGAVVDPLLAAGLDAVGGHA